MMMIEEEEEIEMSISDESTTPPPSSEAVATTTETVTSKLPPVTTTSRDRAAYFTRHLTPPNLNNLPQLDPKTAKVVWRDFLFVVLGCVAVSLIGFVETHASEAEARSLAVRFAGMMVSTATDSKYTNIQVNPSGIVDTGYIVTQPLYEWLRDHRDWADTLALINSLVLILPSIYVAYVTVWRGDYSCVFRVLAVQLLRAFCGWYTYLPPDPTYLSSNYDFPDFVHCLFQECSQDASNGGQEASLPFVSFFSGHVATMVVAGNHMWLSGYVNMALLIHVLNLLQIVRLLATRGHYSIDMIIGWYVAVYVSNPAGRLGRYYSRGTTVQELMPKTPQEALETLTGVQYARYEARMSALSHRPEIQKVLQEIYKEERETRIRGGDLGDESDTTAKIMQEAAAKMMRDQAHVVEGQMNYLRGQKEEQMNYLRAQKEAIEIQMNKLRDQAYAAVEYSQQQLRQQQAAMMTKNKVQ